MTDDLGEHTAAFQFQYDDERTATVVERSVRREVGDIDGDRSRATVDRDGATLALTVTAADLVGLRAGVNTWLGLVATAERSIRAAG